VASDGVEHMRSIRNHIPTPKRHLPGHAESYKPPPEYLFDKREIIMFNNEADFSTAVLVSELFQIRL
jgi:ribosome biogenesis protein ERB1